MNWREAFLKNCGPGLLGGITFSEWTRLLREYGPTIHPQYWPRSLLITLLSLKNSLLEPVEERRYGADVDKVVLQPPLFVIGHWRSGTTHLHQLIAQDQRFAYPNLCQVSTPRTFLTTQARDEWLYSRFMSKKRPIDNMEWSATSPQEDEIGLCAATLKSPYVSLIFPNHPEKFVRYLTFRDVPPAEVAEWRRAFERFLKKLQLRLGRPLVLKSPPHTARIRLLLEMFPQAKFVHIHREPYTVFRSTRQMLLKLAPWYMLQKLVNEDPLNPWILRVYREMYDAFFAEKKLIPAGQFHELAFEQLEKDPVGEVQKLYEALNLPPFTEAEPGLRRYVDTLAGYKKGRHEELNPELKTQIGTEWRRTFEEWGYAR